MIKYYKPARDKNCYRGFFSYISESICDLYNAEKNNPNENIKIFYDLVQIPGYGNSNLFDICFTQDNDDYDKNRNEYLNIENTLPYFPIDIYNLNYLQSNLRESCESIVKKFLNINSEFTNIISIRHSQIDFDKTIGFHRRATDMERVHNIKTLGLESIFSTIEKEDFESVFLMSDNLEDLQKFRMRYGKKLITFDDISTSKNTNNPFFKNGIIDENIVKRHIQEIVFGAFTLGKVKKLFCTKSNLSGFSILSNSKLEYKILQ